MIIYVMKVIYLCYGCLFLFFFSFFMVMNDVFYLVYVLQVPSIYIFPEGIYLCMDDALSF